jgi:hypothetical protein
MAPPRIRPPDYDRPLDVLRYAREQGEETKRILARARTVRAQYQAGLDA